MKTRFLLLTIVLFTIFNFCTNVFGSGFALYENSPKGSAMSGAYAARANDASALWYNPAGITNIQGSQIMVGATTYLAKATLKFDASGKSYDLEQELIPTPYVYAATQLSDKFWAGIGIFSPFGLSNEFDSDWEGRYNAYYSGNVSKEINPNLIYKVNDSLSLGFGFSIQQFEVKFKQKINAATIASGAGITDTTLLATLSDSSYDIDQVLFADDSSEFRYNFSIQYQYNDKLSFGFNYRSEVDYTMDGTAKYKNVYPMFASSIYNTDITGGVTLPEVFWFGTAYQFTPKFSMEIDIVRTGWSSYDKLNFNINNAIGATSVTKNWKDVNCYRLGFEYAVTENLAARWGILYDETPIPDDTIDYAMPSDNRYMFTCGLGYKYKEWTIDSHYALVAILGSDREINTRVNEGIIADSKVDESFVHQFGLSLSRSF